MDEYTDCNVRRRLLDFAIKNHSDSVVELTEISKCLFPTWHIAPFVFHCFQLLPLVLVLVFRLIARVDHDTVCRWDPWERARRSSGLDMNAERENINNTEIAHTTLAATLLLAIVFNESRSSPLFEMHGEMNARLRQCCVNRHV